MRLPKWLKRHKRKPFEASMPIDNPDLKIVEARYKKQPFFIGIGASKQRALKGSGEVALPPKVKGEYQSQKDLSWQFFYNLKALPEGFMTGEKLKDFMASTVSVVSGGTTVVTEMTIPKETKPEKLNSLIKKMEESGAVQFMYFKDRIIGFNQNGKLVFEESENSEDKRD